MPPFGEDPGSIPTRGKHRGGREGSGVGTAMAMDEDLAFWMEASKLVERLEEDRDMEDLHMNVVETKQRFVGVTRITAHEWCQQQAVYLEKHLREGGEEMRTEAMVNGEKRHKELELEVVQREPVQVQTKEDAWAINLLNLVLGLEQLRRERKTRELLVFGVVQGQPIIGIIDELFLEGKEVRIRDHKTRQRPTIPGEAQKRTAKLQLMCYCTLLHGVFHYFHEGDEGQDAEKTKPVFDVGEIVRLTGIQSKLPLSTQVRQYASSSSIVPLKNVKNLADVFHGMRQYGQTLHFNVGTQLYLRYEWQENLQLLGEEQFEHDKDWMAHQLSRHLPVLRGRQPPQVVPPQEGWKCQYCQFSDVCPAPNGLVPGPWSAS